MADTRDRRVRIDLIFDAGSLKADQLRDLIEPFVQSAKNINVGKDNEETGYVSVERCGHSTGQPCEVIERWEVGKGRVI